MCTMLYSLIFAAGTHLLPTNGRLCALREMRPNHDLEISTLPIPD